MEYRYADLVNTEIKIDLEKLPKVMQNLINDLEKWASKGEWAMYDSLFFNLEVLAKNVYASGSISKEMYQKILLKYGGEFYGNNRL